MSRNSISPGKDFSSVMSKYEGEAVLFVDKSEECFRLLEHLESSGALKGIKVVEVNGLRGWLMLEYGTAQIPLLITENRIIAGAQEILSYFTSSKAGSDEH